MIIIHVYTYKVNSVVLFFFSNISIWWRSACVRYRSVFFLRLYVGCSSSRSRGAVHSVNLTRGVGILLCYIGPEHVLKLLRTGSIHLDSTYNVLLLSTCHMGHLGPCDYLRTGYSGFNSHSSAWRKRWQRITQEDFIRAEHGSDAARLLSASERRSTADCVSIADASADTSSTIS